MAVSSNEHQEDTRPSQQDTVATPGSAEETRVFGSDTRTGSLAAQPGTVIGRYTLMQILGEGGFGVVFRASQEQPVRRTVALKIIKLGMDTRQVISRFEAERQALAMMNHPGICKVLDAGATEAGRPYFVMELVKGIKITKYCDRHKLDLHARLRLFQLVCGAVQHAHQKGIIHRDIKPSNILVAEQDGLPHPKIIDFGIAKATEQRLTDETMQTEVGQFVGTPAYMSPEQAESGGADIDTRSDIYSLGILLYELLTGTMPFDTDSLRNAPLAKVQKFICEMEPQKPSTRISAHADRLDKIADRRGVDTRRFQSCLRGDLDWMILRALEKDRSRRYETANALSADIQRYLNNEPVVASPPTASYRFRKFARRNRTALTAVSLVLIALLSGTGLSVYGLMEARREREQAIQALANEQKAVLEQQQARAEAEATTEFLSTMLYSAAPARGRRDVTVLSIIKEASDRIDSELADQPLVQAHLHQVIGATYESLGDFEKAIVHGQRSYDLRIDRLDRSDPRTLISIMTVASNLHNVGRHQEAEKYYEQMVELQKEEPDSIEANLLYSRNQIALKELAEGNYTKAERMLSKLYEVYKRVVGPTESRTLVIGNNLVVVYWEQGRLSDAQELGDRLMQLWEKEHRAENQFALSLKTNLANVAYSRGDYERAVHLYSAAMQVQERTLGKTHIDTLRNQLNLALNLKELGKFDEALVHGDQAHRRLQRSLGKDHLLALGAQINLGAIYSHVDRLDDSVALFEDAVTRARQTLGTGHSWTWAALDGLMQAKEQNNDPNGARAVQLELIDCFKSGIEQESTDADARNELAKLLLKKSPTDLYDPAAALSYAEQANSITGHENPQYLATLAMAHAAAGNQNAATEWQEKALTLLPDQSPLRQLYENMLNDPDAAMNRSYHRSN